MTSPLLDDVDSIVQDYAVDDMTEGQALASIRNAGGQPTPELLADAVRCWRDVVEFQPGGSGDPHTYLEVDALSPAVDGRDLALRQAEEEYDWSLLALAKAEPSAHRRAS